MAGGTKRRRKAPPAAASSPIVAEESKPTARASSKTEEDSFLKKLLLVVTRLSVSDAASTVKQQSTGSLLLGNKALVLNHHASTKAWPDKLPAEEAYSYALTLATHVVHRLTEAAAAGTLDESTTVVLAGWSRLLWKLVDKLVPTYSRWDKATGSVRHWLARLVATVSGAALTSLTSETADGPSLMAATVTLEETLLNTSSRLLPVFGQGDEFVTDASSHDMERFPLTENPTKIAQAASRTHALVEEMVMVPDSEEAQVSSNTFWTAFAEANSKADICTWTEAEEACLKLLQQNVEKESVATPKGRRKKSGTWQEPWNALFKENKCTQTPLDGRLTPRRWVPVLFDWYLQAGPRILVKCQSLLAGHPSLGDLTDTDGWTVSERVLAVVLVGRWGRLLAEFANRSGSRPTSLGGFDAYVRPFIPIGLRAKGKVTKKTSKPDTRDVTMVTLYALLETHASCLRETVENGLPYCLWVPDCIVDLASAAAGAFTGVESSECVQRLEHGAAAFIPTILHDTCHDWILRYFGMARLYNLLSSAKSESITPKDFEIDLVESQGVLTTPSTLLTKPPARKKKKYDPSKPVCSYAGVYPHIVAGNGVFEKIALHLRGYSSAGNTKQSRGSTSRTTSFAVEAVTEWFSLAEHAIEVSALSLAKKGKGRKAASNLRPSKRRKREAGESKSMQASIAGTPQHDSGKVGTTSVLSAVRACLVSKLFRLVDSFIARNAMVVLRLLLPSLENYLIPKGIGMLLDLNLTTQRVLFTDRRWDIQESDVASLGVANGGLPSGCTIMASHESELWSSLIAANATFGAGREAPLENKNEVVLGGHRLEVYRMIAGLSSSKRGQEYWPLWLPTPTRVFVSCNVCVERHSEKQGDLDPDRLIVRGFVNSLEEWFSRATAILGKSKSGLRLCVEEEVALSLFDARLFLGSSARLPYPEQVECLGSLLKLLQGKLALCASGRFAELVECRQFSSFLARLVTTVVHVAALVGCTPESRRYFYGSLNDSLSRSLNVWATSDRHVPHMSWMGLFSNFESTDLPDGVRAKESLPIGMFPDLRWIIEKAFGLGFRAVHSDYGHLLHAAWNAHGMAALWAPVGETLNISCLSLDHVPSAILAVRDDLCLVHQRIRKDKGVPAKSSISKLLDRNRGDGSPRIIVDNLRTLIGNGSDVIHRVLTCQLRIGTEEQGELLSAEVSCLLECLCVCVSFALSSLTVADSNFFAELVSKQIQVHRARGYSTDSERVASEFDSCDSNDARVGASERLAEVCRAFGAVPAHPDCLDSSCSLRYGVSRPDARGLAVTALRVLTRLVKAGIEGRETLISESLRDVGLQETSQLFVKASSLMRPLASQTDSNESSSFAATIASVCGVDVDLAKLLIYGHSIGLRTSSSDFWSPNAAQRVIGAMHGLLQGQLVLPSEIGASELRASGDWEVALAKSLLSGFFDINDESNKSTFELNRWSHMTQSALEWMVPACALLRFSLQTTGGKPHPLKSLECSIDEYLAQENDLTEPPSPGSRLHPPQREEVLDTLRILSNPVISGEKPCEAIAFHLLADRRGYKGLVHSGMTIDAVRVISALLNHPEGGLPAVGTLATAMVECMKSGRGADAATATTRLLASFAHGAKLDVNTTALGKVELTDIVSQGKKAGFGERKSSVAAVSKFAGDAIAALTGLLVSDLFELQPVKEFAAAVLARLSRMERNGDMKPKLNRLISQSIVNASPLSIKRLFRSAREDDDVDERILIDVADIFAAPFFSDPLEYRDLRSISEALPSVLQELSPGNAKVPRGFLNLWFLCGTYTSSLNDIGESLLQAKNYEPELANNFITFASGLESHLSRTSGGAEILRTSEKSTEGRLCSFIVQEGFQEQHWYNCRSCGLVGEKGCCSTCALRCHHGHDVVYARFSSFFCDCGAESSKARDESNRSCRCLALAGEDIIILPSAGDAGHVFSVSNSKSCTEIATRLFRPKAQQALLKLRHGTARSGWVSTVVESLRSQVHEWINARDAVETQSVLLERDPLIPIECVALDDLCVLHCSKSRAFDIPPISEALRQRRTIMAADGRGRMVLCEGSILRFFAVSTMINSSFANDPKNFLRDEVPTFGSMSHDLKDIVGLRLCNQNEAHLLAWSPNFVRVYAVRPTWDGISEQIQLPVHEMSSSALISCEWLPGVEGFLAVCSKKRLQIFGLKQAAANSAVVVLVGANSQNQIADFAIVGKYEGHSLLGWKVFVLLESGGLREMLVTLDDLSDDETTMPLLDCSNRVDLLGDTMSSEPGTGQHVDFIAKGSILVCQTSKWGAVGCRLSGAGDVERRLFTIPSSLPLSAGRYCSRNGHVDGPYTHWQSFSSDMDGDVPVIHLCCAAKVRGVPEFILFHFELGEDSFSMKASAEFQGSVAGLTVCTVPWIGKSESPFNLALSRPRREGVVISLLASTGRFASFTQQSQTPDLRANVYQEPPVLTFETLRKISPADSLAFHVDGVSDGIGPRLLRENDEFFESTKAEGFTMNISLNPSGSENESALIIAAIRVQVGRSSTSRIPSRLFVEGRRLVLKKDVEDWYSFVLTAEEVARSVRKGFVTLKVDRSHLLGSTPVVDAVEVYATPGSKIGEWLTATDSKRSIIPSDKEKEYLDSMLVRIRSMRDLRSFCTSTNKKSTAVELELLRRIVYETAIGCPASVNDAVITLASAYEKDIEGGSQAFLDTTRIKACSIFIEELQNGKSWQREIQTSLQKGEEFVTRLEDCLRLSSRIARNGQEIYRKAVETKDGDFGSIALPSSIILNDSRLRLLVTDDMVTELTELCLVEMAIEFGAGFNGVRGARLGQFAALQRLLQSQTGQILTVVCKSVHSFCLRFQSPDRLGSDSDLFAVQPMMAYYGCDSCSLLPITGTRYTLPNSFDLCEKCYNAAAKFAATNNYRDDCNVIVNGKTVGNVPKLNCAEIETMTSIATNPQKGKLAGSVESSGVDDGGAEIMSRQQVYEDFLGNLFFSIIGLFAGEVRSKRHVEAAVIRLATDLVTLSAKDSRTDKKKRLAKEVVDGLTVRVEALRQGKHDEGDAFVTSCFDALSKLIVTDEVARLYFGSPQTAILEDAHPRIGGKEIKCKDHRCSLELRLWHGKQQQERRFLCCKMNRCGSFGWVHTGTDSVEVESCFDEEASSCIWKLLSSKSEDRTLLTTIFQLFESRSLDDAGGDTAGFFPYTPERAKSDLRDGVLFSWERTKAASLSQLLQRTHYLSKNRDRSADNRSLIDVSLVLLSLTAPPGAISNPRFHDKLCEIILSDTMPRRKDLAKTALYRLCGSDHVVYHRTRDHFALSLQMGKLVKHSEILFLEALKVKEKAHVCGKDWRTEVKFTIPLINGLDFLGIHALLPEGTVSGRDDQAIRAALEEILSVAKRRSTNWQAFCLSQVTPATERGYGLPPLATVLSLAVLLHGETQVKALKLCELALQGHDAMNAVPGLPFGQADLIKGVVAFSIQFVLNGPNSETRRVCRAISNHLRRQLTPDDIREVFVQLIRVLKDGIGDMGWNAVEFIALLASIVQDLQRDPSVQTFALMVQDFWLQQMLTMRHHRANEELLTSESRSNAMQRKRFNLAFCAHCSKPHSPNSNGAKRSETAGRSGTGASSRSSDASPRRSPRASSQGPPDSTKTDWIPQQVSPFSRSQLQSFRESHVSDAFSSYVELKLRLVVSSVHLQVHDPRGRFAKTVTVYCTPRHVNDTRELTSESYRSRWETLGEMQLDRGASRASIALTKPVVAANLKIEYTDFYERPGDSRQSDEGFVVHCPRCSRVVQNAHGVCGNCGEVAFQCRKCRHINYDRLDAFLCVECGYCASGSFSYEVVAATASNAVAITSDEECAKAQGILAACTRVREDTRQLLKGRFASLIRATKRTGSNETADLSEDLKLAYEGKLPVIPWQKPDHAVVSLDKLGKQGSVVRSVARPQQLDIAGRGSTDRRGTMTALTKSTGGSSSGSTARRTTEDMVVQQIRAEIDEEESELLGLLEGSSRSGGLDSSDPIGRLLARVRSRQEQSQNERQEGETAVAANATNNASSGNKNSNKLNRTITAKDCLELCDRLHMLMREAEREAFCLKVRIQAWQGLCRDDLAGLDLFSKSATGFAPCRCWSCSSTVASCLLNLWQRLFLVDPTNVEVSPALVDMLLHNEGSSASRALQDCKRSTVEALATRSETGTRLVLEGLRARLNTDDVYAAELLQSILEALSRMTTPSLATSLATEDFAKLATEQLERHQSPVTLSETT